MLILAVVVCHFLSDPQVRRRNGCQYRPPRCKKQLTRFARRTLAIARTTCINTTMDILDILHILVRPRHPGLAHKVKVGRIR